MKKPKRLVRTAGPPDPEFAARATLKLFLAFIDGRARRSPPDQKEKPSPAG